jgi:hypothetical protein
MTQTITVFGHEFAFAPTLPQRRFAGRAVCVLISAPLILMMFAPLLLQSARIW